jgi:hypothetical protein
VPGGAIRASVGLVSNIEDVEKFLTLLETTYRDRPAAFTAGVKAGEFDLA